MSSAREQANTLLELLRRERGALAEFLAALADFDRRGVWVELGHASLFAFLVKDLGLSSGAAAYRKAAVELVQRFPQVLEHLRSGELCMTTVFELSKVITEENAAGILPRFFGASKRDAQNVVAELAPVPAPQRTVVTAIAPPPLAAADPLPLSACRLGTRRREVCLAAATMSWTTTRCPRGRGARRRLLHGMCAPRQASFAAIRLPTS